MKLTKLELLNFKGLKSFAININGDVVIRGDNATGKTTVFDLSMLVCYSEKIAR